MGEVDSEPSETVGASESEPDAVEESNSSEIGIPESSFETEKERNDLYKYHSAW